jgi:hypothetical protein
MIMAHYKRESDRYRKSEKGALPLNYYFKTQGYIHKSMTAPLPREVKTAARAVLNQ